MNTNKRVLHFLWIFLLAFACCNCTDESNESEPEKNEPEKNEPSPEPDNKPEQARDYFSNYLAGNTALNTNDTAIALSDIATRQEAVWKDWVDANKAFPEDKLPATEKLDNEKTSRWSLPDKLEPHAIMPFYWGSKGEATESGYPLFIYLHGSADKNVEWRTGLSLCKAFDDAPSIYFIPQIPNTGDYYRWWQKAKQFAWERLFRLAFLDEQINPNRFYFIGISEGGYGSQQLASFYADYLAGAGPMAGGEPLKKAPVENCRHIAFSLLTGAKDDGFQRNTLTQYTKDEFERLQKEHPEDYVHRIELIPNMGHQIDYSLTTPWLKGNKARNPYPKAFTWENFEMDGLYRDAFYNLAVLERSNDNTQTRSCYEMQIDNNRIELNVNLVTYKRSQMDPTYGIEMKFDKTYKPATKGKVLVYLNDKLVDLSKEVTLVLNGKEVFKGMVQPKMRHLINSCATFYDPARLYPAAIEAEIK